MGECILQFGGGGGVNDTLPPIPAFSIVPGNAKLTVNMVEADAENQPFVKEYIFTAKANAVPQKVSDGIKVTLAKQSAGKARSVEIAGLTNNLTYYVRGFATNLKNQLQTMLLNAVKSTKIGYEAPSILTPLSKARALMSSAPFASGVGVFGGRDAGWDLLDTVDFYDSNRARTVLTSLSQQKTQQSSCPLADGAGVFGGGIRGSGMNPNETAAVDFYDAGKVKSVLTPLSGYRRLSTASLFATGAGVFGGSPDYTTVVDFYDSAKVRSNLTGLSQAIEYPASAPFADGVLISGRAGTASVVDFYNSAKVRTTLTPLTTVRAESGVAPFAGGAGIFGGADVTYNGLSAVDFYDAMTKTRTTLTPLSAARRLPAASPLADGAGVFGGFQASAVVDFYGSAKVRTSLKALSQARQYLTASPFSDGAGVFGGGSGTYSAVVDFYPSGSVIQ